MIRLAAATVVVILSVGCAKVPALCSSKTPGEDFIAWASQGTETIVTLLPPCPDNPWYKRQTCGYGLCKH